MVAAVVTATTEPSRSRSEGSAAVTRVKNAPASSASWAAISAPVTRERCFIGTCGPAAYTKVCSASPATASGVSASALARTPHARASSTAFAAAAAPVRWPTTTSLPRSASIRQITRPRPPLPPTTSAAPSRPSKSMARQ